MSGARRRGQRPGRRRAPDADPRDPRRRRPRPDLLPRRVRDRRRRVGARDQPVRPAERAGGQGQHQARARVGIGAGARPSTTSLARCWRTQRRRTTSRSWATCRHRTSSTRRSASCAPRSAATTGAATTFGYGPRFLHSTGQLHKGGPPTGRFLQLVDEPGGDAEIPGCGLLVRDADRRAGGGRPADARARTGLPAERVQAGRRPRARRYAR